VQLAQAATQFIVFYIVQDAEAQDEVEGAIEADLTDFAKRPQANVATLPESPHGILAAVHPDVLRARPQRPQHRGPVSLPATDVEYGFHRSIQ
jgi:hypothetical protein